jgi:hypothetical protein
MWLEFERERERESLRERKRESLRDRERERGKGIAAWELMFDTL